MSSRYLLLILDRKGLGGKKPLEKNSGLPCKFFKTYHSRMPISHFEVQVATEEILGDFSAQRTPSKPPRPDQ